MAVQSHTKMSIEGFERIVLLPENDDRRLEYIGGEIVEVLVPFSTAVISASMATAIGNYVDDNHLGYVTGAQGGYICRVSAIYPTLRSCLKSVSQSLPMKSGFPTRQIWLSRWNHRAVESPK